MSDESDYNYISSDEAHSFMSHDDDFINFSDVSDRNNVSQDTSKDTDSNTSHDSDENTGNDSDANDSDNNSCEDSDILILVNNDSYTLRIDTDPSSNITISSTSSYNTPDALSDANNSNSVVNITSSSSDSITSIFANIDNEIQSLRSMMMDMMHFNMMNINEPVEINDSNDVVLIDEEDDDDFTFINLPPVSPPREDNTMNMYKYQVFRERTWSLEECSICCEVMLKDHKLQMLPCGHKFHGECVQQWLADHETCPNCRKSA